MADELRILLIDDNPDDRALVARGLRQELAGLQIHEISGEEGFTHVLAEGGFDLLVTDYRLSWADGLQVLRRTKRLHPRCPVILFTRTGGEEIAVEAMKSGLEDYVVKSPQGIQRLVAAVRLALEKTSTRSALWKNEELYRLFLETANEGVWVIDGDARITYANRRFVEMIGVPIGGMLGRYLHEFMEGDSQRECDRRMADLGKGTRGQYDCRFRTEDGTGLWVIVASSPLFNERGELVGALGLVTDITERKRAEDELEIKARLLDAAADSIYLHDLDGTFLYMNEATYRARGYGKDELMSMNLKSLLASEPATLFEPRVRQLMVAGEIAFESAHVRKDGSVMPVDVRVLAVEVGGKKVAFSVARDITERRKNERAWQEQVRFLQLLIDTIPNPVYYKDLEGRYLGCNTAFATFLRLPRGRIIGKLARDISPPELAKKYEEMDRELFANRGIQTFEFTLAHADGTRRDVVFSKATYADAAGKPAGLIGVVIDITDRKRAEEALRLSEVKFRSLYEQAPLPYQSLGADGRILEVNRAWLEMLGYAKEEVIGRWFGDFLSPSEKKGFEENFPRFKAAGEIHGVELEMVTKAGRPVLVTAEGRIGLDERGKFQQAHCVLYDVTEHRRMEKQFLQAQKMEAVGRLAGGVAHDFNNLLTAITGYTELMLFKLHPDDPFRVNVEEISKAAARAAQLTQRLLAFSRKQVLEMKVLGLNGVVTELGRMLERLIGEDIELTTVLTPNLWKVRADRSQIEQVIMNLAVNARDAMREGGKLTIETSNVEVAEEPMASHPDGLPGPFVMLAIADTGIGMDPEVLSHLFEPFFTTKEKGKGTGLGLPTVYGIVNQSGGHISVNSEVGRGTTFKIYLPKCEAEPEPKRKTERISLTGRGSETILLVEDNPDVRAIARLALRSSGYTVLDAVNADEAMAIFHARASEIEMLVTDVVLTGMNGRELAERLVAIRPQLKTLYMSGYTDDSIVRHGVLDSGVAFLQKPFTPDALARKVREVLDQS